MSEKELSQVRFTTVDTRWQTHADQAMTKMRVEAAEAKVVLIEWNTPESISPDTQEAIGKW